MKNDNHCDKQPAPSPHKYSHQQKKKKSFFPCQFRPRVYINAFDAQKWHMSVCVCVHHTNTHVRNLINIDYRRNSVGPIASEPWVGTGRDTTAGNADLATPFRWVTEWCSAKVWDLWAFGGINWFWYFFLLTWQSQGRCRLRLKSFIMMKKLNRLTWKEKGISRKINCVVKPWRIIHNKFKIFSWKTFFCS